MLGPFGLKKKKKPEFLNQTECLKMTIIKPLRKVVMAIGESTMCIHRALLELDHIHLYF